MIGHQPLHLRDIDSLVNDNAVTAPEKQLICALSDLADPGVFHFPLGSGEWPMRAFVIQHQGKVRAYVNRCPHAGHLLNWGTDTVFTPDHSQLICTSHDALFDPDSGKCVGGPCIGRRLRAVKIEIIDGQIWLNDTPPDMSDPLWSVR